MSMHSSTHIVQMNTVGRRCGLDCCCCDCRRIGAVEPCSWNQPDWLMSTPGRGRGHAMCRHSSPRPRGGQGPDRQEPGFSGVQGLGQRRADPPVVSLVYPSSTRPNRRLLGGEEGGVALPSSSTRSGQSAARGDGTYRFSLDVGARLEDSRALDGRVRGCPWRRRMVGVLITWLSGNAKAVPFAPAVTAGGTRRRGDRHLRCT